jgi:hypothetical protein
LDRLAPLSPRITESLVRRTLVEYHNFVAASLGPFEVIFGMQVVHSPTRALRQSSQKFRLFWCVIRLLRAVALSGCFTSGELLVRQGLGVKPTNRSLA